MKTKYLIAFLIFTYTNVINAQITSDCKCYTNEEYQNFVKAEKHQYVEEGEQAQFTVILSKIMNEDIIVNYQILDGTAKANDDFTLENNTFTIPKGEVKHTIYIPTTADYFTELDEDFTIEITSGITSETKTQLFNKKLIRTRTIVDKPITTTKQSTNIYFKNGSFKTTTNNNIEVRTLQGVLLKNEALNNGTYVVKTNINNQIITETFMVNL